MSVEELLSVFERTESGVWKPGTLAKEPPLLPPLAREALAQPAVVRRRSEVPRRRSSFAPALGPSPALEDVENVHPLVSEELRELYELPMLAAAKQLGMSRTSFKNLCRRNGLKKWPYRLHVVLLRLLHEPSVALAARRQLSRGPPYVIDHRMLGCIKSSLKRERKN